MKVSSRTCFELDPVIEQPGHAVSERAGLTRSGAGDDQRLAGRRGDRLVLLRVQRRHVVDAGGRNGLRAVKGVLTGHARVDGGS